MSREPPASASPEQAPCPSPLAGAGTLPHFASRSRSGSTASTPRIKSPVVHLLHKFPGSVPDAQNRTLHGRSPKGYWFNQ